MLKGKKIGFALTGSHCTIARALPQVGRLVEAGALVQPIVSVSVAVTDSRFGRAEDLLSSLEQMTGRVPWRTIVEVEPIGPQRLLDAVVICPCTGNTLGKLANGITDTPPAMAAKAQLRNGGPVVLAVATNDGLGMNARNLGILLNAKNVYFIPFGQDSPETKPNSLDADLDRLLDTVEAALERRQVQPILVERFKR
ncbi:MAG: dipicolinate synthase subunit B [Bacillota bacterium]